MTQASGLWRKAKQRIDTTAAAARADVALVRARKHEIAKAFYEIGLALVRLKNPAAWRALGHQSFAALCDAELDLSVSQADRFIDVVQHFTVTDASKLGVEKAAALADLLSATPGHDTTHAAIAHGVRLPDGKTLHPRTASVRAIESAAKKIRGAQPAKKRGRRLAAGDARAGAALEKKLHGAGAKDARVHVLAGYAGHPARVRLEIDLPELAVLGKVLHPRG